MPKKVTLKGHEFEQTDDYYVFWADGFSIMVTPCGDPKDKTTRWEGYLHKSDEAATIVDKIESYSRDAVIVIADSRGWFKPGEKS